MRAVLARDPNYDVAGVPASVKGKVTALVAAAMDYAFIGTRDPNDHEAIKEGLHIARYNLEQTVATLLSRNPANAEEPREEENYYADLAETLNRIYSLGAVGYMNRVEFDTTYGYVILTRKDAGRFTTYRDGVFTNHKDFEAFIRWMGR